MVASLRSFTATGFPTGTAAFIGNKPPNLAIGDLMTAEQLSNNGAATYTYTSGGGGSWAHCSGSPEAVVGCAAMFKFADAADVAATSFTFTRATNTTGAGALVIKAYQNATSIADVNATSGTGTALTLVQVTAASATTLLAHTCIKVTTTAGAWGSPPGSAVLVPGGAGTASGTALVYALADEVVGSGATGNRAWTYAGSSSSRGYLIAINSAPERPRNIRSSNPAAVRASTR